MKKIITFCLFLFWISVSLFGQVNPNSTYVKGYYKSNGTYVKGYYRTTPNNTINDNYSTYPNYNPYTGKRGTIQPKYSTPAYSTPTYPKVERGINEAPNTNMYNDKYWRTPNITQFTQNLTSEQKGNQTRSNFENQEKNNDVYLGYRADRTEREIGEMFKIKPKEKYYFVEKVNTPDNALKKVGEGKYEAKYPKYHHGVDNKKYRSNYKGNIDTYIGYLLTFFILTILISSTLRGR